MVKGENTIDTVDLRKKIFQIERLSAMPQVVWKILEALADEKTNAADLERLIEGDPALTSKILALANSAYYGLSQKVTTISRAIFIMGFQELQLLAVGAGLASVFDFKRTPKYISGEALWMHCLAVSWTAGELAQEIGYYLPSEAMIAGLLHDLGKLVLIAHLPDEYKKLYDLNVSGVPYYQAEERLGLAHTDIGYWLAKRWGLPPIIETIIKDHHEPQGGSPYYNCNCLVFLADLIVKDLQFGMVNESRPVKINAAVNALGLYPAKLDEIADRVKSKIPEMYDAWRLMLS